MPPMMIAGKPSGQIAVRTARARSVQPTRGSVGTALRIA
jgi:hypothetical protein